MVRRRVERSGTTCLDGGDPPLGWAGDEVGKSPLTSRWW